MMTTRGYLLILKHSVLSLLQRRVIFFRHCKVPGCEVIRSEEEEEENMVLGAVAAHISFIQCVVCSVVAAKKRRLF